MPERLAVGVDVLAEHDAVARANRARFEGAGVLAINLLSSPGSGKTTLLTRLLARLRGRMPLAVIEGDQQTSRDAERIRATGVPAVQIVTGTGCHLEAPSVRDALAHLPPLSGGVLFIENVGNLVCPAAFDLGEGARVVLAALTEGEDKPLKYPHLFRTADLVVLHKSDLAPYLDVDVERLSGHCRALAPSAAVIVASSRTGEGLDAIEGWVLDRRRG
jgi:hydrogenase nickel incorporation protein HypB